MALKPGDKFADFEITEHIGSGASAIVYKAVDGSGRVVALKLLADNLASLDVAVQRFHNEGATMQRLNHPGIVRVFDYGVYDGRPYLATEFMAYGSLASLFRPGLRIKLGQSAQIVRQVASALDYAHSQGVIHRDLKPENILLNQNRQFALADFGIARALAETRLTASGMMGSVYTISPEQITSAHKVTPATDLYALAVLGYLLTTGYYPFTGTEHEIISKHLTHQPPRPSLVYDALPPALDAVLLRGLAKQPEERYESARAFADAFTAAVAPVPALPVSIQPRVQNPSHTQPIDLSKIDAPPPERRAPKTRSWLYGSIIGLVVLAIGGLAALASSGLPGETDPTADVYAIALSILTETASAWTETASPSPTSTDTPAPTATATQTATLSATPSPHTPTQHIIAVGSPTLSVIPTRITACQGFLQSRLVIGERGQLTATRSSNLRAGPSTSARIIGQVPAQAVFTVLDGPVCADQTAWWQISYNSSAGWTAEGMGNTYWLIPLGTDGTNRSDSTLLPQPSRTRVAPTSPATQAPATSQPGQSTQTAPTMPPAVPPTQVPPTNPPPPTAVPPTNPPPPTAVPPTNPPPPPPTAVPPTNPPPPTDVPPPPPPPTSVPQPTAPPPPPPLPDPGGGDG